MVLRELTHAAAFGRHESISAGIPSPAGAGEGILRGIAREKNYLRRFTMQTASFTLRSVVPSGVLSETSAHRNLYIVTVVKSA